MSEWGPGTPDIDLRSTSDESDSESDEEDDAVSGGDETEVSQNADESRDEETGTQTILHEFEQAGDDSNEWRSGSVWPFIESHRGEYGFLPVFGYNEAQVAAKKYLAKHDIEVENGADEITTDIGGKELSWWEVDSIMPQHPMVLVNPLGIAYADESTYDFRETFRFRKQEHFVFSDSGGYQLMSRDEAEVVGSRQENDFEDLKVYPERLLEWQVANSDAGATIDHPPYSISTSSPFPDSTTYDQDWLEGFHDRKEKSGEMTRRMARRLSELRGQDDHQAEDYIFCPVIHGKPYPHGDTHLLMQEWKEEMYDAAMLEGVDPRGWVVKPEPASSFGQIAMMLGYANEYLADADYLHVLMVGGLLQKGLLMYYAMHSDQFVTSDASSYAAGGKRRQFDLPKTARRRAVIISSRDDDEENSAMNPTRLDRYPCRCQVCSTVERDKGFDFIVDGSGSPQSVTLNMHNLHQAMSIERTFDALLREEDTTIVETRGSPTGSEFWRYVRSMGGEKRIDDLYCAMDYVRLAIEEGLDVAESKYVIHWERQDGRTITPISAGSAAQMNFTGS